MLFKVVLVDVNADMVEEWRHGFEDYPEVEIVHGSMLDQRVSAWVSPTNAHGSMDGGLDLVIKNHLGSNIEKRVKQAIAREHGGTLQVGYAVCVPTGRDQPSFLISAPTMAGSHQNVSHTLNAALACGAAFQAAVQQVKREPGSIESVALPGLGTSTGGVHVETCANLMRVAYQLFQEEEFASFEDMRIALEARLADVAPLLGIDLTPSDYDDEEFE
jgi:O-acetyl-ADP-ribose deacetylase (regulator of RNase III)